MLASRRDALLITGASLVLPTAAASAAPRLQEPGPAGVMQIFHVFATPDGESHLRRVTVAGARKELPVASVMATTLAAGVEDWHNAPFKTFTINVAGQIRAELSDGTNQAIGPGDLVFLEDLKGKGHVTRLLTTCSSLFLRMPDDFDFLAWARG
jgi:hypothetical protein